MAPNERVKNQSFNHPSEGHFNAPQRGRAKAKDPSKKRHEKNHNREKLGGVVYLRTKRGGHGKSKILQRNNG